MVCRLAIALALTVLCRLIFYFFNFHFFNDISLPDLLKICIYGLRFDISAVVMCNILFILLHIIPLSHRNDQGYQKVLAILFYSFNSISLLSNCVDSAYFKFILKRSTVDVFSFFGLGNDMYRLLPVFLIDYWYVFFIWAVLTGLMIFLYKKTAFYSAPVNYTFKNYGMHTVIGTVVVGIALIGLRGGTQLRPITVITAAEYVSSKNIPLIINTPFSIITSFQQESIQEANYFPDETLKALYDPIHIGKPAEQKKINVVIIILESFSKEYIGSLSHKKTHTPFLDSLISQSFVFTNAFANGKRSMEGIPAVVASIPTFMNDAFITSPYGSNQISSIASLLKKKGYATSFYHGGINGTMGFDAFSKVAGFDNYFGMNEYPDSKDYDGTWGIWDEKYLQYYAHKLNNSTQPFCSAIFTLSSHHPYRVPEKYKNVFKEEELPIYKSVEYTDHSLKQFFYTASKMSWYNNTLFVITADHTGDSKDAFYSNRTGMYCIPVIYYTPDGSLKGKNENVTQQADIMPTILDYLNFDHSFFSFGKSVFDSTSIGYAVNYSSSIYQFISGDNILQFDGASAIGLYNYKTDSLMKHNLLNQKPILTLELSNRLKAVIQTYNHTLIKNKMTAP